MLIFNLILIIDKGVFKGIGLRRNYLIILGLLVLARVSRVEDDGWDYVSS